VTGVKVTLGKVRVDPRAVAAFQRDGGGPVVADLMMRGTRVQARARQLVRKRTRTLERSIVKRVDMAGGVPSVLVVAEQPYAMFEHEGTDPHEIRPRRRKALRWVTSGGAVVFARRVRHPGTVGSKFLTKALDAARD